MGQFIGRGYEYDPTMRSDMESYRDMDRTEGRMYYTDMSNMGNHSTSRYDRARRGYEAAKEMNPDQENMEKIQEVFAALDEDIRELKPKMSPSEKSYAKNKLINLSNMMM